MGLSDTLPSLVCALHCAVELNWSRASGYVCGALCLSTMLNRLIGVRDSVAWDLFDVNKLRIDGSDLERLEMSGPYVGKQLHMMAIPSCIVDHKKVREKSPVSRLDFYYFTENLKALLTSDVRWYPYRCQAKNAYHANTEFVRQCTQVANKIRETRTKHPREISQ